MWIKGAFFPVHPDNPGPRIIHQRNQNLVITEVPGAAVVWLIPGQWSAGTFIFAVIFAWAVKAAVIEPFALACLLQVYFKEIEGEVPNPDWAAKLESASGKFRKLGERAMQWAGGRHAPADGT